jgi:hypothetical protein
MILTSGATTCADCHTNKAGQQHGNPHIDNNFSWDSNCFDCHSGANVVTDVHGGTCTLCHSGAPATRHNEMVGDSANGIDGDATQANDTALNGTWSSVTCQTCHPSGTYTWEAIHTDTATAVDHSTAVAATSDSSCETCHTATGSNVAINLDNGTGRAADLLHDVCSSCHTADGSLDTDKDGNGYVLGTMASGDCHQCHTDTYFDTHVHGADTGYINHNVTYDSVTDISQISNPVQPQPCENCHGADGVDGGALIFDSFSEIVTEHETGCARCHTYTPDGTPPDFSGLIGARAASTCTDCHTPKLAPAPSSDHGGHSGNFGFDTECTGCHTGTADVVGTIHNGNCDNCHTTGGPYDATTEKAGDAANGVDGDATQAGGTAPSGWASVTCLTCHDSVGSALSKADAHHVASTNSYAVNGECIACHKPDVGQGASTRTVGSLGNITMPRGLTCNWCHLYWPNGAYTRTGGAGTPVNIYGLIFNPTVAPFSRATTSPVPTHAVSTNVSPPISDYAACFACHGAYRFTDSNSNVSAMVVPFHGLGTPYAGDNAATGGEASDIINAYSGPQNIGIDQAIHTEANAYHPGFGALNWIAEEIGLNAKKPYDDSKGVSPGYHPNDLEVHTSPFVTGYSGSLTIISNFDIPWDDFTDVNPSAPVSIDINTGGSTGTQTVDTTIPILPLTLP